MVASAAESGLDEEGAEFVAIQAEGGGLVVLLRATDMGRWVAFDEAFLEAVFVEAADRRQPALARRSAD